MTLKRTIVERISRILVLRATFSRGSIFHRPGIWRYEMIRIYKTSKVENIQDGIAQRKQRNLIWNRIFYFEVEWIIRKIRKTFVLTHMPSTKRWRSSGKTPVHRSVNVTPCLLIINFKYMCSMKKKHTRAFILLILGDRVNLLPTRNTRHHSQGGTDICYQFHHM
jgi:hypothetical protein